MNTLVSIFAAAYVFSTASDAFMVRNNLWRRQQCGVSFDSFSSSQCGAVGLFAKRRGNLGSIVEETGVPVASTTKKGKKNSKRSKTAQISPDLAKFLQSKVESSSSSSTTPTTSPVDNIDYGDDDENDAATTYTSFTSKRMNKKAVGAPRRVRQTQRQKDAAETTAAVQAIVNKLSDAIVNKTVSHPLDAVTTALAALPPTTTSMSQLCKSATPLDFRLLWVGSDATVCAVGSALHSTVALARLQEVFVTLHRNRVQLVEVLRILGPFPNVKNTVLGASKMNKKTNGLWAVTWDSIIDGTGKERLPGSETKSFAAAIDYADEQLIVMRLQSADGNTSSDDTALSKNDDASSYVVLVRETAMEGKLDQLRAL